MNKEIKDYLHLYLSCDILLPNRSIPGKFVSINESYIMVMYGDSGESYPLFSETKPKPILRPLSDMTEEEAKDREELGEFETYSVVDTPEAFRYLLSKHFDLFGLIEAGLAIDKTKN